MLPFLPLTDYGEVIEEIGSGGQGDVYSTDKGYAIKVSKNYTPYNPNDDTIREIAFLRKIKSPYVTSLIDVRIKRDRTSLVFPLALGNLIDPILTKDKDKKDVIWEMCTALATLHNADILHLDIKPENFLVGEKNIQVADLGLSHIHTSIFGPLQAKEGSRYYTLWYRPPEVCLNRSVDEKSDVWALGVSIVEFILISRRGKRKVLFPSTTCKDHLSRIQSRLGNIEAYLDKKGLTKDEIELVMPMLQLDPEKRQTIFQVLNSYYFNGYKRTVERSRLERLQLDRVVYPENIWKVIEQRNKYILYMIDVVKEYELSDRVLAISVYFLDKVVSNLRPKLSILRYYTLVCLLIGNKIYPDNLIYTIHSVIYLLRRRYPNRVIVEMKIESLVREVLTNLSFDLSPIIAYTYISLQEHKIKEKATSVWKSYLLTEDNFEDQFTLSNKIISSYR